tara:strand:+ start:1162 stop:1452 length:291 start_codon:yes stop_codon:yes gene_type:complete
MGSFDKYKKSFIIIIISFLLSLILVKYSLGLLKSEISNIVNSKKFEIFLFNQVNNKIQNFADKDLTEEEYIFYKKNFKKIFLKYKPIFDEIIRETN